MYSNYIIFRSLLAFSKPIDDRRQNEKVRLNYPILRNGSWTQAKVYVRQGRTEDRNRTLTGQATQCSTCGTNLVGSKFAVNYYVYIVAIRFFKFKRRRVVAKGK